MIWTRCGRCGKRIPSGSKCDCRAASERERHKVYDRTKRNKDSYAFYHSMDWIRTRQIVLDMDDGLDVYAYMTRGEILPADTVHHIIPLRKDASKALDPDNLMSLHHSTHSFIEQMYESNERKAERELAAMLHEYRSKPRGR